MQLVYPIWLMVSSLMTKLLDSKMLWKYVKPAVRQRENQNGVLILDDSIEDKPYTDENEVNCWHYSHAKEDIFKGHEFPFLHGSLR